MSGTMVLATVLFFRPVTPTSPEAEVASDKREREIKECFQTGKTKTTKAPRLNRGRLKPQTRSCTYT